MQEEKRNNNTVWYRYKEYSFKVKKLDGGNAVVWVNFNGYNVAFSMIISEFLYEMEEYDLDVTVNTDWNNHRGFEVAQKDVDLLIGEILNFCNDHNPEKMELTEKYIDSEWYA